MAFFGPGVTLNTKPRWRQGWWWREKLPAIIGWLLFAALAVAVVWVVFTLTEPDDTGGGQMPSDTVSTRTTTPTPTGPARPTEKPPELPDAAREGDPAGVEATIRFENDAINYAQRTGDLEPLRSVYNMSDCKSCKLHIEELSKSLRNGATYIDRDYVITSLTVEGAATNERGQSVVKVTLGFKQPKDARRLDKSGTELERIPATPVAGASYELAYGSDGWTIQEINARSAP